MTRHFSIGITLLSALAAAQGADAAGTFTFAPITGDADSGISAARTYTHAVDFRGGLTPDTATTISGVPFHVGEPNGPNYSSTGLTIPYFADLPTNSVPSGPDTLYDLFQDFYHNSARPDPGTQTLTLTGLTPGTTYATTFYNVGFDLANARRVVDVTTSDGGSLTGFDQNFTGEGNLSVLRYTFTATDPSITFTFDPAGADTFHHYGFTNEVVPEPAAGLVLAAAGLLALRRRRAA
ncbi:MAG TPA: hypothetical protein VFB66_27700 [Tepidisphaeraceae bacterium]|nr:hypothetical protein [Tepidisphaeraceae bacterium]